MFRILSTLMVGLALMGCSKTIESLLPEGEIRRVAVHQSGFLIGFDRVTGSPLMMAGDSTTLIEIVPTHVVTEDGQAVMRLGYEEHRYNEETGNWDTTIRGAFGTCTDFSGDLNVDSGGGENLAGQGHATGPAIGSCRAWEELSEAESVDLDLNLLE